jgi:hypothetical protein
LERGERAKQLERNLGLVWRIGLERNLGVVGNVGNFRLERRLWLERD